MPLCCFLHAYQNEQKLSGHTHRPSLIIVDDDPLIREGLAIALGDAYDVCQAESRMAAISKLRELPGPPQLALIDLGLPPHPHRPDEGFQLIAEMLAHAPNIKIFVLSGQNDTSNARHARAMGAIDFIAKPCTPENIHQSLKNALSIRPDKIADALPKELTAEINRLGIVGMSQRVKTLRDQIIMYASTPFPVLIEGESGSGKELVANAIQKSGPNPEKPYKVLNCAAIAPTLIEPTLFGYSKGAFTGAATAQSGFFEDACDGTLFLDEIGELPLELQTKLLRVLENGEYQRVGETTTRTSSARIIAATNRNLRDEVRNGHFRGDLYHRLNVFQITVPPLRELGSDKQVLLDHFRTYFSRQTGHPPFELNAEALQLWNRYNFPGNTRELRNIVIRLSTKYPGRSIGTSELSDEFDPFTAPENTERRQQSAGRRQTDITRTSSSAAWTSSGLYASYDASDFASSISDLPSASARELLIGGNFNLDQYLRQQQAAFIGAALGLSAGNISEAARLLGLNRTTLHSRMGTHEKVKQ